MEHLGEQLKKHLSSQLGVNAGDFEGASEDEIRCLESFAGGRLPLAYKHFLMSFGRSAGPLFKGTQYAVGHGLGSGFRGSAEEILSRSKSSFALKPNHFVFLVSQGYQFSYFSLEEGDDPAVFHYLEYESESNLLDASLTAYLWRAIYDCERHEQQRRKRSG